MGGPDLRPVADEIVAIFDGAHLKRRQIRARAGLRIALAPEMLAAEDLREEKVPLFLRSELRDHMRDHLDAHRRKGRRPGRHALTREDIMLERAPVAAAMLDRPCGSSPSPLIEDGLPFHAKFMIRIDARHEAARLMQLRRQIFGKKAAHFITKCQFLGAPVQVHGFSLMPQPSCGPTWRRASRPSVRG